MRDAVQSGTCKVASSEDLETKENGENGTPRTDIGSSQRTMNALSRSEQFSNSVLYDAIVRDFPMSSRKMKARYFFMTVRMSKRIIE